MPDTSLPSLADSDIVADIAQDIKEPVAPLDNFAETYAKDETSRVAAAARWSRKFDPDSYAKAKTLGLGIDPEIGVRQMDLLQNEASIAAYGRVFEKAPSLRGYFAEKPKDLPLANPDELDNISGLSWATSALPAAMQAGYLSIQASQAANRVAIGKGSIYDKALLANYSADRTFGAHDYLSQALVGVAGQVAPVVEATKSAMRGSVLGGATGAVAGSIEPGAGTAVGALAGAMYGGVMGAYNFMFNLNAGQDYIRFSQLKSEDGKSIDPQVAYTASRISGMVGALLDTVGIGPTVKAIPGAESLVKNLRGEAMEQALKNPSVRSALYNFSKNVGEQIFTETGTEVLQQGVQIMAGEIAKANSDGKWEYMTPTEIAGEMAQAGYQALQVMSLIAPIASSTRFGRDLIDINRSKSGHDALDRATAQLADNKFVQRSPATAADVIDRQLGDQMLYIPAEQLSQYYQEQGLDRYGPPLPNWRQRLDDALSTGGDVQVTFGEYIAHLVKDPKDNPLRDLVRTDPTGYTKPEIQVYSDALDEILLSEVQKAQKQAELPAGRLKVETEVMPELKALRKQILAIGYDNAAADKYTSIFNAFFQTLAQRTGRSPSELFNEFGVEVRNSVLPTANTMGPNLDGIHVDKLGRTIVRPQGKATIELFDGHDMSTLLHESGHFFLDTYSKVAKASPEVSADFDAIKKEFGIDGPITVDQHEKFARSFESYLYEGKAPSPELRTAFEGFRRWLKTIYQNIRKLGGKVSPEIAKIFDRMLATDQRIEQVATDTAYAPIFQSAADMGLDPEEYIKYSQLVDELRTLGQDKARERIEGQTARLAKGWRGEIQKQLQKDAESKLKGENPYRHFEKLKNKQIRIDKEAFTKKYSAEAMKAFPKGSFVNNGLDLDMAAELMDYPTADEMVYDFTQAEPLKDAAKHLAEQEMVARYGEDFDDLGIMDLAVKSSMAADGRLTILATELKALSRKNGVETSDFGPKQLAREIARKSIYAKQVKDVSVFRAQAAVNRSASMAQAAIVKGDWASAADWKRKQLIAQAVANETEKVDKTISRIRDKAAKYARTTPAGVDPSYMEQIRALVEKYDFAKISGNKLERRITLREFVDKAIADGEVVVNIPDRLFQDIAKVSYKELQVEDLFGLGDTLDNLEHLGRTKAKLKHLKEQRDFAQVKGEILEGIKQRPAKPRQMKTYTKEKRSLMDKAIDIHSMLLKPEQVVAWLDLDDIKGPMMTHVFNPMNEALNEQNELAFHYNQRIMEIFNDIPSGRLMEERVVKGQSRKFTREEIYATALNTGNESSRKKLLEGEGWSEEQLTNVLAHMEKEDWDRVQKTWNVLQTLWPRIAALEKKLTGVTPPEIEPREFSTPFGDYKGGYYPVVYDFKARRGKALEEDVTPVDKRFANGLFSNDYVRPGTNHKYTVRRTKTAKPINLSLGILPGHIQTVIHDLTHREAVKSAYKLLWDPEIQRAIEDVESRDVYMNLQRWLKSIATERHQQDDAVSKRIQHLRTGMTIYGLGFRVTTVLAQALGMFPSMIKVRGPHLLNAVVQLAQHPVQSWDFIQQSSVEMRHRMNQQDRDIKSAVSDITRKHTAADWLKNRAFTWIGWMDRAVSSATWLGAYGDYLSQHPKDHDTAVMHADRTVRLTQGTGNIKDMAAIMNSDSELNRLFTMFYSGFSAQYNLQADLYRKTKGDIDGGNWTNVVMQRLPQWMFLVVMPALLGKLITGDTPDDDENKAWWAARSALLYPLAAVPFVRDMAGALDTGFDYKMSPISRVGESSVRALRELWDLTDTDKEFEARKFIKPAAEVGSIVLKLPTGQAISTIDNLWKGLEKKDLKATDLVFRRKE